MKRIYSIFVFLSLVACVAQQSQEQNPAQVPEQEQPTDIAPVVESPALIADLEPKTEPPAKKTVTLSREGFDPELVSIMKAEPLTWKVTGIDFGKIACYKTVNGRQENRLFTSERVYGGETFTYTFIEPGEYLCIDAVYGSRSAVLVSAISPMMAITGNVVMDVGSKSTNIALLTIIGAFIYVLVIFARKQAFLAKKGKKSRNV